MKIAISHMDAFRCYRSGHCDAAAARQRVGLPQDFIPRLKWNEAIYLKERFGTGIPLQVDVLKSSDRRICKCLECHILPRRVQRDSFVHLGRDTHLAAPELCAFELRTCLSEVAHAFAISELCSDFSITQSLGTGYRSRPPLTNIRAISDFADGAFGVSGVQKFQRTLSYSFDNAHSPMELILALLFSLPASLGGYGFPKPQLNEAVCGYKGTAPSSFVPEGHGVKNVHYGDLVYTERKVVVEYMSKSFHQGRWDTDALRGNELLDAGYKTIYISPEQVLSPTSTHAVANKLARQLDVPYPEQTEEWLLANEKLRRELFENSNFQPSMTLRD